MNKTIVDYNLIQYSNIVRGFVKQLFTMLDLSVNEIKRQTLLANLLNQSGILQNVY